MKYQNVFFILFFLWSCDIKKNNLEIKPEEVFQKIYDNEKFSLSFESINTIQTADGGYIVYSRIEVAASNFGGVYLQKIDRFGNFVSAVQLDESYTNPLPNLFIRNNSIYFFTMDKTSLTAKLVEIDKDLAILSSTLVVGSSYPLACSEKKNGNFLLLYYNRDENLSVCTELDAAGQIIKSKKYDVGSGFGSGEPNANILAHLIRPTTDFPFAIGETIGGQLYFNGFNNYAFSTTFFLFEDSGKTAIIQGFNDQKGISSLLPLTASDYAICHFNSKGIFVLPKFALNTTGISSTSSLKGYPLIEFSESSKIISKKLTISGTEVVVFAGQTNNNYFTLYFYNALNGNFMNSIYVGYGSKHKISDIINTKEGGIAIVGTVYLIGKLPRIFLFKYSNTESGSWVK